MLLEPPPARSRLYSGKLFQLYQSAGWIRSSPLPALAISNIAFRDSLASGSIRAQIEHVEVRRRFRNRAGILRVLVPRRSDRARIVLSASPNHFESRATIHRQPRAREPALALAGWQQCRALAGAAAFGLAVPSVSPEGSWVARRSCAAR